MGWKGMWERYQMAATFAEAGEHETARHILKEGTKEKLSPEKVGRYTHDSGKNILRPSHAEG